MTVELPPNTNRFDLLISQMIETRHNLLRAVDGIEQPMLDYTPSATTVESIATLLLHIEGVEWAWVFEDIFGQEMDFEEWKYAFPLSNSVNIKQLSGKPLDFYLERLNSTRNSVLRALESIENKDTEQIIRTKESEDGYSLGWILHHIIEHEAIHIGQISLLKRLFHHDQDITR